MGDVKGGPAFTHVSYDDFRIIRDQLDGKTGSAAKTTKTREAYVPSVTYTDPQCAHVGPRWGDLEKGRKVVTYSMPGSWIARGLETDETKGLLKAVVDPETDKIISFSAISTEGGELMAVVQMAMYGGVTWRQLQDMVFAHPSWAESLNNLWGGDRKEITI
jgi:pyruvate/2-oxoglutarate dehydrogenase complex dihydrolipoamide dehydrogenase (E3) component